MIYMDFDGDEGSSGEVFTRARRGGRLLGQPSLVYWGWVECRTLQRVLLGWRAWSLGWSVVVWVLRGGRGWYGEAGGGCCRERSCVRAVKPGAHDCCKLLLHCLLTRGSGIIGLRAFCTRPRETQPTLRCAARKLGPPAENAR